MRKIKVAQIGMNPYSHGPHIFCSLKKQTDVFEIAGYALPENERERFPDKMQHFDGYRELSLEEILNDPTIEAVFIETEECVLTKYAMMAVQKHKHVHMEKPGGAELAPFEALVAAAKKNGTLLHLGYMYRYNPEVIRLLADIKEGKLGDIISVEAQMNCLHSEDVRRWLAGYPGGMMFFLGCHLVDLILLIQGLPRRVIPMNKSTGHGGIDSLDFGMAIFEYDHGVSFAKTSAMEYGGFMRRQLVVSGTRGCVELNPLEMLADGGQYTDVRACMDDDWFTDGERHRSAWYDRYDPMTSAFAAMVRGECENPYTYDYELSLYRTLMACVGK